MTTLRPMMKGAVPKSLIFLLGGLTAFGPLSIDLYLPALPIIGETVGASAAEMQRTLAAFIAGLALGQIFYGPLSDRIGRRVPLLAGISLFVLTSIGCVFASTGAELIFLRFVQGLGSCAALVIARAIVRDRFDHQDTARIISWIILVMGLAPIFAPLIGTLILAVAEWTYIFWALAAYGVFLGVWVLVSLGETRTAEMANIARKEKFFSGSMALLRDADFRAYMFVQAFNAASLFAYVASAPAILIGQYAVSETAFSLLFAANSVGIIGGTQINRYLLDRFHADQIMETANRIGLSFGVLLLIIGFSGIGGLYGIMTALFLVMSTYGIVSGNANAGGLSVDPRRAGSASALLGASAFGAGAIAAAVTSILPLPPQAATALVCFVSLFGAFLMLRGIFSRRAPQAGVSTS